MATLLIVGAGLFGSQAAAYARSRGLDVQVFDAGLENAASPAAAGLFKEEWAGKKLRPFYDLALPLLDSVYGIRVVHLLNETGQRESFQFVPPRLILDPAPIRQRVNAVGDGWLEAEGRRHEGWVYIAAGVWSGAFAPDLALTGKAGSAFLFPGESQGRIRPLAPGGQALTFCRDLGSTYFSDGTAEVNYTPEHDRLTLRNAAASGLTQPPLQRLHGIRPYTPGGPVFRRLGEKTWLATGGRKMGTILGAAFALRLVDQELGLK